MNEKNEAIQQQIDEARAKKVDTIRSTSPELEKELYKIKPVLDHGFIRVVDYMGDDSSIVQAARVSYGTGTKTALNDKGLINYLMKHYHTTPFEMCEIKFHIKAPIFVARQWLRHRTASVNEYSARYSVMEQDVYIPELDEIKAQSADNKQGRGEALSEDKKTLFIKYLKEDSDGAFKHYYEMINEDSEGNEISEGQAGLAREIARGNLPLSTYTQFYWKINLHNLLHFLKLRADSHAQYEIRVYAETILEIVKLWVPTVYNAFVDYRVGSKSISSKEIDILKQVIKGDSNYKENLNKLSKREARELKDLFDLKDE